MASHIKNPDADGLARRATAPGDELAPEGVKPSLVELSMKFSREVRARGDPKKGQPADKAFIDSLYEDD
jgi:antitoxin VapB